MSTSSRKIKTKALPAISVQGLSVSYGTQSVIEDVSFDIRKGVIAALIGPNGSGKTTLLRSLLGLVPRERGEILFHGKELAEARPRLGYVPQRFAFDKEFPLTVREFLGLAHRDGCEEGCAERKVKEVGLTPLILDKRLGSLSGGQLQRVLIANAILNDPDILLLDEPSTGIDIIGEAAFYDVIEHLNAEHGTTVLLVSHDVAMVSRLVDTVICVNRRLLCVGPPQRALTERKLSELYGGHHALFEHHQH